MGVYIKYVLRFVFILVTIKKLVISNPFRFFFLNRNCKTIKIVVVIIHITCYSPSDILSSTRELDIDGMKFPL